jgi:transcriptional repressor NrdR
VRCPFCGKPEDKVVDSRSSRDGATIRRRRECLACTARFTTYEAIESVPITVCKRDGKREAYDRAKIVHGVELACAKRAITSDQIERLIDDIEVELFNGQERDVPSSRLGEMVLLRLDQLDKVARVRFASVFRDFKTPSAFVDEVKQLT